VGDAVRIRGHDRHLDRAELGGVKGGAKVGNLARQRFQRHETLADHVPPELEASCGGVV
jgi:hypothetical protein